MEAVGNAGWDGFPDLALGPIATDAPSEVSFGNNLLKQKEGTTECNFQAAFRHFSVSLLLTRFEK